MTSKKNLHLKDATEHKFDISKIILPTDPGIYIMKDSNDKIIYIGKAKNLKKRVRSYFTKNQDNYKTQRLVCLVTNIEFVITDTEGEAFLLESNLIKQYRPRFNIELKDQQRYTYLRISDEKYPRLLVARRTREGRFLGKGETFGPFVQGSSKLLTVGALRKAFQIRICKTLPKKVCLEYYIGNCEGPCEFVDAQKKYSEYVNALKDVLTGSDQLKVFSEKLRVQMNQAADARQFERAIELRDTITRLDTLDSNQKMEYVKSSDEEYFGIGIKNHAAVVMTFRMIHGVIRDSEKFFFDVMADNSFSGFIYQYYTTHRIPRFIILSEELQDANLVQSLLSERAGFEVKIIVPQRGKRSQMITLLMKNIDLVHEKSGHQPGLADLQKELQLPYVPQIIECFDISNHGDAFAVGAMSRFVNGSPDKSGYRRFRIKSVSGRDDFAMIREVVFRRYRRLLGEINSVDVRAGNDAGTSDATNDADDVFENNLYRHDVDTVADDTVADDTECVLPDLILIDGGKGQLNAALTSLHHLGLDDLPCVSIAKENEELYISGQSDPIVIPKNEQSLQVLRHARDEAHRFGVSYNRIIQRNMMQNS